MYQRILVPTDGSEISQKAARTAIELARLTGGQLFALSVKEPFPYGALSEVQPIAPQPFYEAQERLAADRVAWVAEQAQAAGVACGRQTVEALHPWEAVLQHAKAQRCDLVVMASHGRRGVAAVLLGSETQKVLTHGDLPVLVVR